MSSAAVVISGKHLIFPWRRMKKPWELTFWTLVWNFLSWTSLYLFSEAKMIFEGKLITSFSELLSSHPIFAFLLLMPPLGLCQLYYVLGKWLNQTHLIWENGQLLVGKRPLPWSHSSRSWADHELKNIWAESYSPGYENGVPLKRLRLKALLANNTEITLIDDLLLQELSLVEKWMASGRLLEQEKILLKDAA